MEKLMTYDEIEKVYGLQPEKIGLWLSKGYIPVSYTHLTLPTIA